VATQVFMGSSGQIVCAFLKNDKKEGVFYRVLFDPMPLEVIPLMFTSVSLSGARVFGC
jgi:hypothetical protein